MIRLITGLNRHKHMPDVIAMHRLRKRVFHDFLHWDVTIDGELELDHYDLANPLYVLSYAADGRLRGSLRLLPTLGPNMLDDTFPMLLDGQPEIRSAAIWESSRFCIDPEISQDRASNQVTEAAAELMCGVGEYGARIGISHIVTVTDVFLERMFRRMGCPGERIGSPQRIGSVMAVAVGWEITGDMLEAMKTVAGLSGSVLDHQTLSDIAAAA